MFEVNIVALVVISVLSLLVGTLWYSDVLFLGIWLEAHGLKKEDLEASGKTALRRVCFDFFTRLGMFYVLFKLLILTKLHTLETTLKFSILLSLIVALAYSGVLVWERKSFAYFLVNAGYLAVVIVGGVAIMIRWPW